MRLYLQILLLTLLLYSCHGSMSDRGGNFNTDRAGDTASSCTEQTSPSPQCPQVPKQQSENKEQPEIPTESDASDSVDATVQLTTYKDGMWGEITLSPLTMKKNTEARLEMTFTATKAIDQQNVPINLAILFPSPTTGFKVKDKIEVTPTTAQDFFERAPSIFTSSVTNEATIPMIKMAKGEQFTLTFTITPQQDFVFKAYTSTITRLFKNSRGETPEITVYTGDTPPVITPDPNPVYANSKLEMSLEPWPHKITKDTDSELTLTFKAVKDLERKSLTQHGRRTHDVAIGVSPRNAVSTYRVKSVSTLEHFKKGKARCSLVHNCKLEIVEMKKGESFVLKLTVNASKNFSIGWANGIVSQLMKKPDGLHTELDNKLPQVEVR